MAEKASLQSLGLGNEKLQDTSFDDIPENLGQSYPDPVEPGVYRFQLPTNLAVNGPFWSPVSSDTHGKRINVVFDDDAPLVIVQSPGKAHDGESFTCRISNVPRERGKEKILVNDMQLLLRALGETKTPASNAAYAQALSKYAGKTFTASIEWSWRCRDDKPIYVDDGAGGSQKVEDKMGCGARYYQSSVDKVEGKFPLRITCGNPECGASLRAFPNIGGFKGAPAEVAVPA
jgi:hypothetical protein